MALSDLEQLEGPWMELMQSKDPESVAVAFRLALAHLTQTSKRTREGKQNLINDVRTAIDDYDSVFLFSFDNMRR